VLGKLDIIQNIIFERKVCSYLEIGVGDGVDFAHIQCPHKVGVEVGIKTLFLPPHTIQHGMPSDEFFQANKEFFAVIFINGDYSCTQTGLDIKNALKTLDAGGVIMVYDLSRIEVARIWRHFERIKELTTLAIRLPDGTMIGVIERSYECFPPTIQNILRGRYECADKLWASYGAT
jgi:hypothetical protein